MLPLTILITEDSRIFLESGPPVVFRKEISPKVLIEAIRCNFVGEDEDEEEMENIVLLDETTPILPRNTIAYKGHKKTSRFAIALLAPAEVRNTRYFKDVYAIPYPDLVFFFQVDESGTVVSSQVLAAKTCLIDKDTKLYKYPYSNVDPATYEICFGENFIGKIKEPRELEGLPYLFFEAPCNDDHYIKNKPFRMLLEELNGQSVFPEELFGLPVTTFERHWEKIY